MTGWRFVFMSGTFKDRKMYRIHPKSQSRQREQAVEKSYHTGQERVTALQSGVWVSELSWLLLLTSGLCPCTTLEQWWLWQLTFSLLSSNMTAVEISHCDIPSYLHSIVYADWTAAHFSIRERLQYIISYSDVWRFGGISGTMYSS